MNKMVNWLKKFREQLWFRPLIVCVFSIGVALLAKVADGTGWHEALPNVKRPAVEELLTTLSSSMLVIAVFAVSSMIAAFNAASNSATPRSFKLIIADDASQNALSVFVGAFIYSIVSLVALKSEYYGPTGLFILFIITVFSFVLVILTFLRWVNRISRLGRMGNTIQSLENATAKAIDKWKRHPYHGGNAAEAEQPEGIAVHATAIGYVIDINMQLLQQIAEKLEATITLRVLPGKFVTPEKPLLFVGNLSALHEHDLHELQMAIPVSDQRSFDNDIRFGIIALSEIASRALSPAVNDPGTAIAIIGSHVRLFHAMATPAQQEKITCHRVYVPALETDKLFTDAFRPIARDGAAFVEVQVRLLKALSIISGTGNGVFKEQAILHSHQALVRAKQAMVMPDDYQLLQKMARECGLTSS